uniref:Uncharacterized protein n=1 Tax=Anguilla anguilla TaxID=7936 RepID=A0A0E9QEF1_ANGAN
MYLFMSTKTRCIFVHKFANNFSISHVHLSN